MLLYSIIVSQKYTCDLINCLSAGKSVSKLVKYFCPLKIGEIYILRPADFFTIFFLKQLRFI